MANRIAFDKTILRGVKEKVQRGLLPQWAFTDEDIYRAEVANIFSKTWNFLGHESEIEKPGDYVTRWIVHDPVLLLRDENGQIQAYLNSCTHRGTKLCTADFGQKKTFTCPYHGWTFNLAGDLIGIVAGNRVYGEEMDRTQWSLRKIPKVSSYCGMIFGSLDEHAEPLEDFLGDMKWYFDIMLGRSDAGMEVRGVPQKWIINTNWKISADNFGGDPYHTAMSHRSTVELGISPKDPMYASYGHQVVLDNGHGINMCTAAKDRADVPPYQGLPPEMWPMFKRNLSAEQLDVFEKTMIMVGNCFPNLSFVSPMHGTGGPDEPLTSFVNFRVWRPVGPTKIEVTSWFMVDKEAPESFKQASYLSYIGSFGPAGTLEQDDAEIWTRVAETTHGTMAQDKDVHYNNALNYLMGLDRVEPDLTWPGPGTAYPTCYLDAISRAFYEHWVDSLLQDADVPTGVL
ncbi:aromatic ring-hydroxylating oxygenase subunit alpha [Alicyclobacillus fastidiosus]|uniref:Aromatic ring-hydroxylating dioxygenase subunit alpha n=1 Tax=Alicyclobacillus fastidiosus TaxID=392011 RepID=A0ABV5AAP0_9BACL|nr:aromatic ring-hydroxylating dioxygenase subunit alpha [Alicyclobacillus fastidiosus]WEH07599.1 aromatic ring-hydroxylating dioxygenase subunit alpha [Alicyclobacillus fastidiosus]